MKTSIFDMFTLVWYFNTAQQELKTQTSCILFVAILSVKIQYHSQNYHHHSHYKCRFSTLPWVRWVFLMATVSFTQIQSVPDHDQSLEILNHYSWLGDKSFEVHLFFFVSPQALYLCISSSLYQYCISLHGQITSIYLF